MDNTITMMDNMQFNNKDTLTATGIGLRLKNAREALNMSDKDAAARLHLNVKFINIMETEDFQNGPPVTFIRGYMRSYAKMLNLPVEEVDAAIDSLGMSVPTSTVVTTTKIHTAPRGQDERYIRWITYLIVAILLILVAMWWSSHTRDATLNAADKIQPQSLLQQPAAPATTTPVIINNNTAQPAPTAPVAATAAPAPTTTVATPAATPPATTPATPVAATTTAAPVQPTVPVNQPAPGIPVAPGTPTPASPVSPAPTPTTPGTPTNPPGIPLTPGTTAQVPPNTAPGTPAQPTAATAQPATAVATDSEEAKHKKSSEPEDISHMKMVAPEPGLMGDDY